MKVGGNASFTDWLAKHPGTYNSASTDPKAKYSSKAAETYREELKRRAAADEAQLGPRVVVASSAGEPGGVTSPGVGPGGGGKKDEDFFDTWNKPGVAKPLVAPAPVRPPGIGNRSPALTPNGSRAATPRAVSPAVIPSPSGTPPLTSPPASATALTVPPAQPRTISSSSLRGGASAASATTRSKLGATKVGGAAAVGGKSKLGAVKKAGAPLNFEEAERKAKEEEERIRQLGYDRRAEEEAAAAAAAAAATASAAKGPAAVGVSNGASAGYQHSAKKPSIDDDRLGMGFRRLGFGQVSGMGGAESAALADKQKRAAARAASGYVEEEVPTAARERFGTQKGAQANPAAGTSALTVVLSRDSHLLGHVL